MQTAMIEKITVFDISHVALPVNRRKLRHWAASSPTS
jgi:hypothetical protein